MVAHDGTKFGVTDKTKYNANIVTASAIPYPKYIRFWVSKTTTDTSASTWTVKTKKAGDAYYTIHKTQSAVSMNKGEWVEVYVDLSDCSDVYIAITYENVKAERAIDDLELGLYSVTFCSTPDCSNEYPASVTEWGQHSVVLSLDASLRANVSTATGNIGDTLIERQTVTAVNGSMATAKNVRVPLGNINLARLAYYEGKVLHLDWHDASDATIGSTEVRIPRIIADSRNMHKIGETSKIPWDTEVHVLPGVTLSANTKPYTLSSAQINELHIYPGATLNVTSGTLTAKTLRLHNGWTWAGEKAYDVSRVYIADSASLIKNTASIDYSIYDADEGNCYHPLSVPFPIDVEDVNYADSYLAEYAIYGRHYVVKSYDGANRAENGVVDANWVTITDDETLQPGVGYILTAVPVEGEAVIRFPLTYNNTWTTNGEQATVDAQTKNVVDMTAHSGTASEASNMHAGWNMVGVPYMSSYAAEEESFYVSIPTNNFSKYVQENVSDITLLPGWSFFVQVAETGTYTFASSELTTDYTLPIRAPQHETQPVVRTGIILSGNQESDKTTFIFSDRYSSEYEIGADLEKLFGNGNTLSVYSISQDTRLAFNAMQPMEPNDLIPLGVRLPQNAAYTFSYNGHYDPSSISRMELFDYQLDSVTDLIKQSYTFTSTAMQYENRFALRISLVEQTSTTNDYILSSETIGARKIIRNGRLLIMRNGGLYDVSGEVVE